MRLQLRPALAVLAVVILSLGTRNSFGFWSGTAFVSTVLALALAFAACLGPEIWLCATARRFLFRRSLDASEGAGKVDDGNLALFAAAAVILSGFAMASTRLFYAEVKWAEHWLIPIAVIGFVITLAVAVSQRCLANRCGPRTIPPSPPALRGREDGREGEIRAAALANGMRQGGERSPTLGPPTTFWRLATVVVLVLGLLLRATVVLASPDPVIDVHAMLRDYGDALVSGGNPYRTDIASPYETERARHYGITEPRNPRPAGYPPLPFLAVAPFRALDFDPRWANVLGDLVGGLGLFALARQRRREIAGFFAVAAWSFLPRVTFIIEQAWYEPVLVGLFGLGFLWSEAIGWRRIVGYVLLGLALTAKQFGLPILPALAWPQRRHWKPLLLGLVGGSLVALPWFLWSPGDFLDVVLWKHLQRPPQYISLTVGSALQQEFGITVDQKFMWMAAGILIVALSICTRPRGSAAALAVGTALAVFCIFHSQGFPNYFYLVQFLWLFGGLAALAPETGSETAESAQLKKSEAGQDAC